MNEALLLQQKLISVEGETVGIGKLMGNAAGLLQSYLYNVRAFIGDLITPMANTSLTYRQDGGLNKLLGKTNYISIGAMDVFVPPGMTATYPDFLDALEASQDVIDRIVPDTLQPSILYFTMLLGNPESLSGVTRRTEEAAIKFQTKEIEQAKKKLAACYAKNGNEGKRAYGDVFRRNQDWLDVNQRIEKLMDRMNQSSAGIMTEKVNELVELMDRLVVRMKQSPDVYAVSGVTGKSMAAIAMNLGQVVEFYGAHHFTIQTLVASMMDNIKRLHEILKD